MIQVFKHFQINFELKSNQVLGTFSKIELLEFVLNVLNSNQGLKTRKLKNKSKEDFEIQIKFKSFE
jgi:hypothetical protein